MQLIHLPTAVEAVPWDDTADTRLALERLGYTDDCGDFAYANPDAPQGQRILQIPTMDRQTAEALPGESWIVRGATGEWYCIRNEVRAAGYVPIDSEVGRLLDRLARVLRYLDGEATA